MPIPPELFHYTTAEGAVAILKDLTLAFTPPSRLNDPFEFMPGGYTGITDEKLLRQYKEPQRLRAKCAEICQKAPGRFAGVDDCVEYFLREDVVAAQLVGLRQGLERRGWENYRDAASDLFGVACFSETEQSPVMWAHYAKNAEGVPHHGAVIAVKPELIMSVEKWLQVGYPETEARVAVEFDPDDPDQRYRDARRVLSAKAHGWKYEAEWRLLARLAELTPKPLGSRTLHLMALSAGAIARVVLGCRMDSAEKGKVRCAAASQGITTVQQAHEHKSKFLLEVS